MLGFIFESESEFGSLIVAQGVAKQAEEGEKRKLRRRATSRKLVRFSDLPDQEKIHVELWLF